MVQLTGVYGITWVAAARSVFVVTSVVTPSWCTYLRTTLISRFPRLRLRATWFAGLGSRFFAARSLTRFAVFTLVGTTRFTGIESQFFAAGSLTRIVVFTLVGTTRFTGIESQFFAAGSLTRIAVFTLIGATIICLLLLAVSWLSKSRERAIDPILSNDGECHTDTQ